MITNEQMIKGRFLRWHNARKRVAFIQGNLLAGGLVAIHTCTRVTKFNKPAHAQMFKATRHGAYMQQGKKWVCIDYCGITTR